MSLQALDSILEEHRGGIWYLPAQKDARALQKSAKAHRYAFFHIDGRNIARKEQLLTHMANAMHFPKEFGHNWDALEDHLTDLEWVDADGYVIHFDHLDGFAQGQADQFRTLLEILRDAVDSWKEDDTALVVLFSGEKSPKGVPKLGSGADDGDAP